MRRNLHLTESSSLEPADYPQTNIVKLALYLLYPKENISSHHLRRNDKYNLESYHKVCVDPGGRLHVSQCSPAFWLERKCFGTEPMFYPQRYKKTLIADRPTRIHGQQVCFRAAHKPLVFDARKY